MSSRRNRFIGAVSAFTAAAIASPLIFSGCSSERVAELEKMPMFSARSEGTGLQFVGVVVLAKYQASSRQKAAAQAQAQGAVVRMAKPHYERRRAVVQKRIAAAKSQAAAPDAPKKEETVKKLEAELASLDREWQSLGGSAAHVPKMDSTPASGGTVPFASINDREAQDASVAAHVPQFVAVAVPPQGIAAEKGGGSTVMLWDTRRRKLVGDQVFVLNRTLRDGVDVTLDGVSARFAGGR